jgi:hypothetical protein
MFFHQSNDNRVDELNQRIQARMYPSSLAPMNFSPRPVSTKHVLYPLIDQVSRADTQIDARPPPSFLPASSAPFSGFNVQQESNLKIKATLERDSASNYFPASTSDLYTDTVPKTGDSRQPHPFLFAQVRGVAQPTALPPLVFNNVRKKTFTS